MATNIAQISNPSILVKPSQNLIKFVKNVKISDDMPLAIRNIVFKNRCKEKVQEYSRKPGYLTSDEDRSFIKSINVDDKLDIFTKLPWRSSTSNISNDKLLSLSDLYWLYDYIQGENKQNEDKVYLHELLEECEVILPKNKEIPRSEELEKRCQRLKAQQENKDYYQMTKNVDRTRKKLPEDNFGWQVKQMNKHLVAIFQFIVSVAAGFAFGFVGVELIIGSLDFGFRLLLGIICALTIALAELYFLAKRLNEDLQFEYTLDKQQKDVKID